MAQTATARAAMGQHPAMQALAPVSLLDSAAAASEPLARPLSDIHRGVEVTLHSTLLQKEDRALLSAMGLTERCTLRVCQQGEPCIVQVRTTRMGICRRLAACILVVDSIKCSPQ